MRFFCNDCEAEFFEPKVAYEHRSELNGMGGITSEGFTVCPECGSDDIEEMSTCDLCKEEKPKLIWVGDKEVCKDCREWVLEKVDETRDRIGEHFSLDRLETDRLLLEIMEELWN